MHDEFAEALKDEIKNEIIEKTKIKMKHQCELLLSESVDSKAIEIINLIKKLSAEIKSIDDFDFRVIFKRLIIKSKDHLLFILGNYDVSKVDLKRKPIFNSKVEYYVRRTKYTTNFGIIINR